MENRRERGDSAFWLMLIASALLHVMVASGVGAWLPKHMQFLPLPSLNIKLGSEELEADMVAQDALLPPPTRSNAGVITERAVRQLDRMLANNTAPKQYVRERKQAPAPQQSGTPLGTVKQTKQQRITAYTQTISLWTKKSSLLMPNTTGEAGQVVIGLRIDRRGNVLGKKVRQSSGSAALDELSLKIIQVANPFPPVPDDYPEDAPYLEFLIPVSFTLAK